MLLLILPLLFALQTAAGNTDPAIHAALTSKYAGKIFTVRSYLSGNRLRFDADGKHVGGGTAGIFTLDGNIHVDSVTVTSERIELRGREAYLIFNPVTRRMESLLTGFGMRLEFARRPNVPVEPGIATVLLTYEDLGKVLPPYWEKYLTGKTGVLPVLDPVTGEAIPRANEDQGVVPRAIEQSAPKYSQAALRYGVSGSVVLHVVVDEKGKPQVYDLLEPLGYGLDQAAVDAVNQWKFEPARRDGNPLKVFIRIRVRFSPK